MNSWEVALVPMIMIDIFHRDILTIMMNSRGWW